MGERYYLFQAPSGRPSLRTVGLEDARFGPAEPLAPASGFPDYEPYSVIAEGSKVAIAGFGLKSGGICNLPGVYTLADPDTVLGRFPLVSDALPPDGDQ